MSIEYEVRSDDAYSRPASAAEAREILLVRWQVKIDPTGVLLYEADQCRVEIDLGHQDEAAKADDIQWVGLRVPAGARIESARRAVQIGLTLAQGLGWRLFDPQSDSYIDGSDLEPGPPLRDALAQLMDEVRGESKRTIGKRLWLRARRQSARSIGEIAFGAVLVAFTSSRLFGFRIEQRPSLALGLVVGVTALVVAGDIVLDVLGEIHAAATTAGGSRPNRGAA